MAKFSTINTDKNDRKWEENLKGIEIVDIRKEATSTHLQMRLVGYMEPFSQIWVPTEASKAHNPYKLGAKSFPVVCNDFDGEKEEFVRDECPYRRAKYEDKDGNLKPLKTQPNFLIFFLDRDAPKPKVRAATVSRAFLLGVQEAMDLFKTKKKLAEVVDPTDDEAFTLYFKYEASESPMRKFQVSLGEDDVLSAADKKEVARIPDNVEIKNYEDPKRAADKLERMGYVVEECLTF